MNHEPTFRDLGVSPDIAQALSRRGITSPFPIQRLVLESAIAGTDILAQAPTGSGKTLAFALPIIERTPSDGSLPYSLILVPTRELCVQVVEEIEYLLRDSNSKLKVAAVYGGTKINQQSKVAQHAHIVVATPGRLIDLVSRHMIDISEVGILVLDEADRMLDMGFQPQTDKIVAKVPTDRHTMFFSATLEGKVGRVASKYTRDPLQFDVERPAEEQGDIEHTFVRVGRGTKLATLREILDKDVDQPGVTLIFVRTKRGADELNRDLNRAGISTEAMHGDMQQSTREKVLKRFERGELKMLVATDVAARGLDLDDITHVVQFDAPDEHVDYVHRTGRTGRAGRKGRATTLVLEEQQYQVGRIAAALQLEEQYLKTGLKIMAPRLAYASRGTRRLPGGRSGGLGTHRRGGPGFRR